MSRLIKANFSRLFGNAQFRILTMLLFGIGCLSAVSKRFELQAYMEMFGITKEDIPTVTTQLLPEFLMFQGGFIVMFALALFIGQFVGTEYSDYTIRNKLIVGHSKKAVYIANLLVCSTAGIIMHLTYIISDYIFASIMITSYHYWTAGKLILMLTTTLFTTVAFTSMSVLFSMCNQSKASGSVYILVMAVTTALLSVGILDALHAGNYLNAFHKGIYILLDNMLPTGQYYHFMRMDDTSTGLAFAGEITEETVKLIKHIGYSVIVVILSTGIGTAIFNRKNVK
ncbi:MAG: ABC transporter permease subunit [Ruminococcus sp.]|nr:ABC transporter permease subunit [Ruminococcus sp.]